ncbi:NudC domain-containing protein 1 [Crenichthys baileyi]|uniref:NudC domain-containing protein 1 n=1 Tax=Crenichthys baileyi TaxID=28760 RepID=A0AAV9QPZ5_9TELE
MLDRHGVTDQQKRSDVFPNKRSRTNRHGRTSSFRGRFILRSDTETIIADSFKTESGLEKTGTDEEWDQSRNSLEMICGFPNMKEYHLTGLRVLVNLGSHQYLFTVDVDPSKMPCLCLRHDVDALVWQPRPDRPGDLWEHIATFNALGYVQASKRDKKFATCAPDFSYATLCECLRRAFIYRQPSPVETVLFNRKQGRQVGQVAKQQVASLDCDKSILGFRASNERLFILTSSTLFVLKVKQN